jgi:integrase
MAKFIVFFLGFKKSSSNDEILRGYDSALRSRPVIERVGNLRLSGNTASNYFNVLNIFCDWLVAQPGADALVHPNPVITVQMSNSERRYRRALNRQRSLLAHLYSLTKEGKGLKKTRRIKSEYRHGRRSTSFSGIGENELSCGGISPFGYPLEEYWRLVEAEKNPRNRVIWLLCGGGGLRVSEALNLFGTDVFYQTSTHEAIVALANPVEGLVEVNDGVYAQRQEYLYSKYHLRPRCLLPKNDPRHAGWKGMLEGGLYDGSLVEIEDWAARRWVLMEWLLPVFGRMFWNAHVEYMQQIRNVRRNHPYYLINLTRNVGEPMTRSAVSQILKSSCSSAGIRYRPVHKLRHMYGNKLADWGMPLSMAQLMMRHVSPLSTMVYFRASRANARNALIKAEQLSLYERRQLLAARQSVLNTMTQGTA